MANSDTLTCDEGLLLNAEPFGFGPTAAIADFFPHLRRVFGKLGYIGVGHTLDLQRKLPYDKLVDAGQWGVDFLLRDLRGEYATFLTALDFDMAEAALRAGYRVVIYDPLTWYWPSIPPVVHDCLYIAQDFFGVRKRLAGTIAAPQVVAPIVDPAPPLKGEREHVLLNLGGLSNPYWSAEDTHAYARLMIEAFVACTGGESIVIAANSRLAADFAQYGVRNYSREEMQEVLRKAKYAFMTPGLGNIYDAARFGTPTVWLPPANDSQGQQRDLLQAHGRLDGAIDWQNFLANAVIDYRAEQQLVLRSIGKAVASAAGDPASQLRFAALMARLSDEAKRTVTGRCSQLLVDFGCGGASQVSALVLGFAKGGS
jgi:hypothetical protein